MSQENKALVRSFLDAFVAGDVEYVGSLLAPEYVDHNPFPGTEGDAEGTKQLVTTMHNSFSDMGMTVEDQIAEGDKVVTRWSATGTHSGELMGIPASGNSVKVEGYAIDRISEGKIVEHWELFDNLAMMQQIGAIPS